VIRIKHSTLAARNEPDCPNFFDGVQSAGW
jgi:hypothetical protein